jgi:diacylglycerol O-acyltransferase
VTRLSTIDAGFLLTESHHSPKHVAGLSVQRLPRGKGSAWLRRMLADMKALEPGYPFNQKVVTRSTVQFDLVEDEDLDIDYHVRHTVLPHPGTDEQLMDVVARLHMNLLDRERPLWEFHLIEGLSDRRFAFYTKVHHALADGITFGRWFMESGSTDPADRDSPPIWHRNEPPRPRGDNPSYIDILLNGLETLQSGVKTAIGFSTLGLRLLSRRFLQGDSSVPLPLAAPRTPLNVSPGAARNVDIAAIPLEEIRAVGKAQGASINDVVMAICDAAIHRYLEAHGQPQSEPLIAYMPVNLRTRREQQDMEEGNLVSLLQVRLAEEHGDLLTTVSQVRESSRNAREVFSASSRPAIQYYSLFVALLGLAEETLGLGRILPPAINIVVSNVPGVPVTMYYRGAEIIGAYPVSTLAPMTALNITASSYAGTLYFGLVAGRSAIPDLKALTRHMLAAYEELKELTGVQG